MTTEAERAVLDAADRFIRAKEAMLAEDEATHVARSPDGTTEAERALDQAEYDLTAAVMAWREAR
jgi:hypothetical protein